MKESEMKMEERRKIKISPQGEGQKNSDSITANESFSYLIPAF